MIVNLLATILAASITNPINEITKSAITESDASKICYSMVIGDERFINPKEEQYLVKDLSGNAFIVQDSDSAFMIFDPVSAELIEAVLDTSSPFDFSSPNQYYYFGFGDYYKKDAVGYSHIVLKNNWISEEEALARQKNFDYQLSMLRSKGKEDRFVSLDTARVTAVSPTMRYATSSTNSTTYIKHYEYIRDVPFLPNVDNCCGFVAATQMLYYYSQTVSQSIVNQDFVTSDGFLRDTVPGYISNPANYNLREKLIAYNGGVRTTYASNVASSINSYATSYGAFLTANWSVLTFGVSSHLSNNEPVVLFGYMAPNSNINSGYHAVICYGTSGSNYVVHYGWNSDIDNTVENNVYKEVILNGAIIGENLYCNVNRDTYLSTYSIDSLNFGFSTTYNVSEIEESHYVYGLPFKTRRLRTALDTGYTTISGRRGASSLGYLEIEFPNPILSISIDLAYWSEQEYFESPNSAVAFIQCKQLMGQDWQNQLNILNPLNSLGTDRYHMMNYSFPFVNGTKRIRIYVRFDYATGSLDIDRGRIAIGRISVRCAFGFWLEGNYLS